jgi:hypothetical protein
VESSCEHGVEPSGSIKCWEVLEWLHNWRLLKKGSAPQVNTLWRNGEPFIGEISETKDKERDLEGVGGGTAPHLLPRPGIAKLTRYRRAVAST